MLPVSFSFAWFTWDFHKKKKKMISSIDLTTTFLVYRENTIRRPILSIILYYRSRLENRWSHLVSALIAQYLKTFQGD